jgi:hypothetical protein
MSTAETIRTRRTVYVTQTKRGPRFHYFSTRALRLLPMRREEAEASFAAGATIMQKEKGAFIASAVNVFIG